MGQFREDTSVFWDEINGLYFFTRYEDVRSIQSTKTFLIFRKYPKLLPGSKVFVPKKVENNNKTSVGEIVGYTTSLVSIIALIKSL